MDCVLLNIDINNAPNLLSNKIKSVSSMDNNLLICTLTGDVLEIIFSQYDFQYYICKLEKIVKIDGSTSYIKISNEVNNKLLIGGNNQSLNCIDTLSKEILDIAPLSHNITCIDCTFNKDFIFQILVGTREGLVFLRNNWDNFEIKIDKFNLKEITCVKFGICDSIIIIGTIDFCLYILKKEAINTDSNLIDLNNENIYDSSNLKAFEYNVSKTFQFDKSYPTSIQFNAEYSLILLSTNTNKNICIQIKDLTIVSNIEFIETTVWSPFSSIYTFSISKSTINASNSDIISNENIQIKYKNILNDADFNKNNNILLNITKDNTNNNNYNKINKNLKNSILYNELPLIVGNKSKLIISTDIYGVIKLWKDTNQIYTDVSSKSSIHSDIVCNAVLNDEDNLLFTACNYENMIVSWSILPVYNDSKCINSNYNPKSNNLKPIEIYNENIIKEIKFVQYNEKFENIYLKDNKIQIRGFVNEFLNKLFTKKLSYHERKKQYLPLRSNILIDYIYCSHQTEKRNTIKYLHYYDDNYIKNNINSIEDWELKTNKDNLFHKEKYFYNLSNIDESNIYSNNMTNNNIVVNNNIFTKENSFTSNNNLYNDGENGSIINNTNCNEHNSHSKYKDYNNSKLNNNTLNLITSIINEDKLVNESKTLKYSLDYNENLINMLIKKQINLNYLNKTHKKCYNSVIHYSGRFIIITDIKNKTQRIFEGHKDKITTFTIHPTKSIVASSEVTKLNSTIIIWNYLDLNIIKEIQTNHSDGIIELAYSKTGDYIVSLAVNKININNNYNINPKIQNNSIYGIDSNILRNDFVNSPIYSIQIYDNILNINYCIHNLGIEPMFDVKFFPNEEKIFVTVGYQKITIWEINGSDLIKLKECFSQHYTIESINKNTIFDIFLCVDFYCYENNNLQETDVICGTSNGNITGIKNLKFCVFKQKAHVSQINCLKVITNYLDHKFLLISAGEDGITKIWDDSYNLLKEWKIIDLYNMIENDISIKLVRC